VRELRRIDEENHRLLKRLQGAKSTVNLAQIKKDAGEKERFMRMHCERQRADWREEQLQAQARRAASLALLSVNGAGAPINQDLDPECERILNLQEHFRRQLDAEEKMERLEDLAKERARSSSSTADAVMGAHGELEDLEEGLPVAEAMSETSVGRMARLLTEAAGETAPEPSDVLAEALLSGARPSARGPPDLDDLGEDGLAAREAAAAKQAALAALLEAQAVDVGGPSDLGGDFMGYCDVIQRAAPGNRAECRTHQAPASVLAF
jgi:hypothetical protein